MITVEHLTLADERISTLSLLLKTLGPQNEEKIKPFLSSIGKKKRSELLTFEINRSPDDISGLEFLLSILGNLNQRIIEIEDKHLSMAIRKNDASALELLLKALGKEAKDIPPNHLMFAIKYPNRNSSCLTFLLTFLGEKAKDMITEEHLITALKNHDVLTALLKSLGEKAKDIITDLVLSRAVHDASPDVMEVLLDALGEKAKDIKIISLPLSLAIHHKKALMVTCLVNALGNRAEDSITSADLFLAIQNKRKIDPIVKSDTIKSDTILRCIFTALGQKGRNRITTEHLIAAHRNDDKSTLSLLLRTLGAQDEHEDKDEDKVKPFVQNLKKPEKSNLLSVEIQQAPVDNRGLKLLLSLSDENNQSLIEIEEKHLNIAIENNDGDTLSLLLETLDERARDMLSAPLEQAIKQANRDSSRLTFLLTFLGEKAKDMITENHLIAALENHDVLTHLLNILGEEAEGTIAKTLLPKALYNRDYDTAKYLVNALSPNARGMITSESLSYSVYHGGFDIVKYLVNALGPNAEKIITSEILQDAVRSANRDIVTCLVNALGPNAEKIITSEILQDAVRYANCEIVTYLVDALGQNAKNRITKEQLSHAHQRNDYRTLSFLLKTLGTKDKNEEVKSFVQSLGNFEKSSMLSIEVEEARLDNSGLKFLLSLSDENNQRMIEIQTEHLSIAIENNDHNTLILLLETLGEGAKQMLSVPLEQAVRQANRDNRRLNLLLTILGEHAKNMITPELLSLAKQVHPNIFQHLRKIVLQDVEGYHADSSSMMNFFQNAQTPPDSKEGDQTLPEDSSSHQVGRYSAFQNK